MIIYAKSNQTITLQEELQAPVLLTLRKVHLKLGRDMPWHLKGLFVWQQP